LFLNKNFLVKIREFLARKSHPPKDLASNALVIQPFGDEWPPVNGEILNNVVRYKNVIDFIIKYGVNKLCSYYYA